MFVSFPYSASLSFSICINTTRVSITVVLANVEMMLNIICIGICFLFVDTTGQILGDIIHNAIPAHSLPENPKNTGQIKYSL
jgi:putative Mn2+ efflux pump MntP